MLVCERTRTSALLLIFDSFGCLYFHPDRLTACNQATLSHRSNEQRTPWDIVNTWIEINTAQILVRTFYVLSDKHIQRFPAYLAAPIQCLASRALSRHVTGDPFFSVPATGIAVSASSRHTPSTTSRGKWSSRDRQRR